VSTKPDFLLSKWYLDCVADDGDAFIGYSATLQWKALSLHYTSILTHSNVAGSHTATSLLENSFPNVKPPNIHWSSEALGIEGNWESLSPPIEKELYSTPKGAIRWLCLQPHAKASVRWGKSRLLEGSGYVERIEITIPPWQLPITELRWGRFIAENDALVWIDWRGSAPQSLLLHNDKEIVDWSIKNNRILFDGGRSILTLANSVVLRNGPLVSTALSMIPGIRKLFPAKTLQAVECKWLSRGILGVGKTPAVEGWAIHEKVNFS
jgi:hypothetical protein